MADFKVVLNDPKSGKSAQREIKDDVAKKFIGLKIGDTVKGELLDLTGYEFEITGGSDYAGFPMRKDVQGTGRKKILAVQGTGLKKKAKGIKQRKTVCGNTIHAKIVQINLKAVKQGKQPLVEKKAGEGATPAVEKAAEPKKETPKQAEGTPEEKKAVQKEPKKEEPKEASKQEEAKAEGKKEAKPAEEKKEEAPKEEVKEEKKRGKGKKEMPKEEQQAGQSKEEAKEEKA